MHEQATRFIYPTSTNLCPVLADLLDHELRGCLPRQQRLAVAAFALGGITDSASRGALERALALYDLSGRDLLNRPGRLTVAGIIAEVESLVEAP